MNEQVSYYSLSKHAAAQIRCLPKHLGELLGEKIKLLAADPTNATLGSYLLENLKVKDKHAFELTDGYRVVYDSAPEIRIWYVGNHDISNHHYGHLSFAAGTKFERVSLTPDVIQTVCSAKLAKEVPDQHYPYVELTAPHLRILGVGSTLVETVRFCPSFENLRNIPGIPANVAQHVNELAIRSKTDEEDLFSEGDLAYRDTLSHLADFCCGNIKQLLLKLNPEQNEWATKELTASVLVRGCAGSGKTSVALQRAANLYLAGKRVLYLTYTTVLADFAQSLLSGIAGNPLPEEISIRRVDQLASGILRARGLWKWDGDGVQTREYRLQDYMAWACQDAAQSNPNGVLREPGFVLDEVREVIKRTSVASEEEYLHVQRHGRGRQLAEDARRAVWMAYEGYQEILARYHQIEWADVPELALREVQSRPFQRFPYDEVIVDEAQDLSVTDIRLCTMLAPVLFVVGDVAQSIYARGYSWRQAGLEVRGHSYSLRHNYRNTWEIAEAGQSLLTSDTELAASGELVPAESAPRHGPWPIVLQAQTTEMEVDAVCGKILMLTEGGEVGFGDCAVLCSSNKDCEAVVAHLAQHGIPAWTRSLALGSVNQNASTTSGRRPLDVFDGTVKVLTYHSAKGLEFPIVFVLGCHEGILPHIPRPNDQDAEAELRLQRHLLYVSMTRAIEAVYLVTSPDTPSQFLSELPPERVTLEKYDL